MHDQRSCDVAADEERADRAVLELLLDPDGVVWSDDELARELGDPLSVTDSLARLYGAGLIHRLEGFAFATRAAARAGRLALDSVADGCRRVSRITLH